ncbi:leucyl-tRNA synthetase [Xylaria bambusicola]|uniref:leucyl-tRNA synthetase n=1 Tax=Xylaria bambusicola TaxID=326684 RepID=UPI0020088238|nr:leucyl-tRNA synthetase [Xylaria bambusicola]KAI0516787.1 leucyl-tRNA synthetase [Xylaria bambusicola]
MATADQTAATKAVPKLENTEKRDTLIADELRFQAEWEAKKLFETNAPAAGEPKPPKYFATMAYPWLTCLVILDMNGTLHAGHAFTLSKLEFMVGWARMQGQKVLFPQGYHCGMYPKPTVPTGMPIKAAADKLKREVEMFGQNFENVPSAELEQLSLAAADPSEVTKTDISKFSGSKSKAAAKTGKAKYQFEIMLSLGFPVTEIHKFADAGYWLHVFPQLCESDLRRFGARVDWRRSFVTTDANPFYDSFIRWQMNKLKALNKIKFGKRFTVYSPKDGQACLDHDRSAGEGITVQEYVALKLRTLDWCDKAKEIIGDKIPSDADVYFIPATLRPETMYGQTCCFVGPTVDYGIFRISKEGHKDEYFFCSERSARNMAFQGISSPWGEYHQVVGLKGSDVIGTLVHAPLSVHEKVRILPMATVKPTKGTGVVTCVPSDSPDDYATTLELKKKPEFYGIQKEWLPEDILPIIKTPSSDLIAKHLYETMKINSPKDQKLAEAKDIAYKEGFYSGVMVFGEFAGKTVIEAKPLVKAQLLESGLAFNYGEPDGLVISRSGDECVAAYLDQWFWTYGTAENGGDQQWFEDAFNCIESDYTRTFSEEGKNFMKRALLWLAQWACTRSYGLGTKLPWDDTQLVESLSDSTIYMAYYTVCHFLHSDIYGKVPGLSSKPISPSQMTEGVWNYIFATADDVDSDIPRSDLDAMRNEFTYFYPLDVRISGKDLITNHLLFFLYHHVAIFDKPFWPKGIRANGHLMLNGEKMSKSTGNFLTLRDAMEKYGSDATRISLADGGDGIEDANLEEAVCNATILRIYELRKWLQEVNSDTGLRTGKYEIWEQLFDNELNILVSQTRSHYEATSFKLALKSGFYDFIAARDWYRDITKAVGISMHHDIVRRYTELQALLLAPMQFIWRDVLKHESSIHNALFPEVPPADASLSAIFSYVRSVTSNITAAEGLQMKKLSKGKTTSYDPKEPKRLIISVAKSYPEWQEKTIDLLAKQYESTGAVDVKELTKQIDKKDMKKVMPFVQALKKRIDSGEKAEDVFSRRLPFDEAETLQAMVPSLMQTIPKLEAVEIAMVEGESEGKAATPGTPVFTFENIK